MTSANRPVVILLAAAVAAALFWFLALAPKRDQASELSKQVKSAESAVAAKQQEIAAGDAARQGFSSDYQQLVLLGKAVPAGDDTASLMVELDKIAERAGVQFRQLRLAQSVEGAPPAGPPEPGAPSATAPVPEPGTTDSSSSDTGSTSTDSTTTTTTTTTAPAPATESAAASMPLGATVGPAGLAVMPYELQFSGTFFQIADFLAGVDKLVKTESRNVAVDGRLVTVDGFALSQNLAEGYPALEANLLVTTYVAPAGEGLTGGATPTAPAPTGTADATTTSTTTSSSTTTSP